MSENTKSHGASLVKEAVNLLRCHPLINLQDLCDKQQSISTSKLLRCLDSIENDMKQSATNITALAVNDRTKWMPIATAKTDKKSKDMLLYSPRCGGFVTIGRKRYGSYREPSHDDYCWRGENGHFIPTPTHWMPKPQNP